MDKKFKGINPGFPFSVVVEDGDVNYAIKQWKKIVKDTGIVQECYDRKFFKKPSETKRLTHQLAKYKLLKDIQQDG